MDRQHSLSNLRIVWVITALTSGGIASVCRYAAETVARHTGSHCTLLVLHQPQDAWIDEGSGMQFISLGMPLDAPQLFLEWLERNPQDVVITNDVSKIEPCFPFFPKGVVHIVQMHDSGQRYLNIAIRNQSVIDGVLCVARHVEDKLRSPLANRNFHGLIGTVYNGADFPVSLVRPPHEGPLRLLFMGSLDPLIKGIFDLVPILHRLNKMGVPVQLTIAGGRASELESRFKKQRLDHLVTWMGRVAHEECYRLAAENDVFMLTSRHEAFGMVTIEAMCMGCVPIANDIPSGSREIIEHGKNGFLLPLGNFQVWAETIKSLHETRRRLREMSQAAMVRARTDFNCEKLAKGLGDFLNAVLLNSQSQPARRKSGMPEFSAPLTEKVNYRSLPPGIRSWVRNTVGSSPHLSWWWLNR